MRKIRSFALFLVCFSFAFRAEAKPNFLKKCWQKQVNSLQNNYLSVHFEEKNHSLEHSFEPWEQTESNVKGTIWVNATRFMKQDTLRQGRTYYSKTQLDQQTLLFLDYGDDALFAATQRLFQDKKLETVRYSPMLLIDYFYQKKVKQSNESNAEFAVYTTVIHQNTVKLYIKKSDNLLAKVSILSDDELFGDVLSTYFYVDFSSKNAFFYPKTIKIDKINGKLKDEIHLSLTSMVADVPSLLEAPKGYSLKEDEVPKAEIKLEKYSPNIHFLELKHTDDKVMLVEFSDFLLVAEAPLNSKNGELIIEEARKIAPNKPIKYFVFGHYHPHYLGGLRAFVHAGARIICSKEDSEYVRYIAEAPHTIQPDALQTAPKSLIFDEIKDTKTITDGKFELQLYVIGKKSEHTKDYLVYYFPSEKLLFEDDLVWIKREGELKKAGARQAGLYHALKDLGLDINTIIQSWPVADYGVKTRISFEELEKSVNLK